MPRSQQRKKVKTVLAETQKVTWQTMGETAVILASVIVAYILIKGTGVLTFSAPVEGVVSLGAIVFVGLLAATSSCLAIVGGLLLSVSAHWHERMHSTSRWEKFQPLVLFNIGRLAGYFILGGLVGLLGKALTLSLHATGMLTVVVSLVMLFLGLQILRIVPKEYCRLPLPARMRAKIAELSKTHSSPMALALGALTFFLPCGFTQSMQLLALASGNFLSGGLIMLAFALGTLPSLLGISALSSVLQGKASRIFLKFSGAVVLLLGFLNLQSGLLLTGIDVPPLLGLHGLSQAAPAADPYVTVNGKGQQIISLYVSDRGYAPDSFTIAPGKETWVYAVARRALTGCANFLTAPAFNLITQVHPGGNWLGPIENPRQNFTLLCSAGILRAEVHVKNS